MGATKFAIPLSINSSDYRDKAVSEIERTMTDDNSNWTDQEGSTGSDGVLVVLTDRANPSQGKLMEFSGLQEASREIEGLLESGYEKEQIRVFQNEFELNVTYRPVVTIGSDAVAGAEQRLSDHLPRVTTTNGA